MSTQATVEELRKLVNLARNAVGAYEEANRMNCEPLWEQAQAHYCELNRLAAFRGLPDPPGMDTVSLLVWASRLEGQCQRRAAEADALPTAAAGAGPRGKRKRMTVAEANQKAMELVTQLGKAFFALSESEQARRIGCSWKTWSRTEMYQKAQKWKARSRRLAGTKQATSSPPVASLTDKLEAVAVEGGRNPVLDKVAQDDELARLVAESQAENAADPSPLDPGPRKVHVNKRL
jgi:hypothetical protein